LIVNLKNWRIDVHKNKVPPCLIKEVNFCRGCPGWSFMVKAQKEKHGLWAVLPIYCPVVDLKIYPSENNSK
jgi:hypothetical protein